MHLLLDTHAFLWWVADHPNPWHHRDPFDWLLIAQCQVESMTLVSVDQHVLDYEISTLW
jgi:PIN domain nuclease of toxin-antitoxin system